MDALSLTAAVRREVLAHPGVTEGEHRFGGIVFHLGRREIGHLHGETVADLPFPPHLREEIIASGRAERDHAGSESAWVSRRVSTPEDVAEVVELFRISLASVAAEAAQAGPEEDAEPAVGDDRTDASWREGLSLPSLGFLRRRRRRG